MKLVTTCIFVALSTAVVMAQDNPISVSGFNKDEIADGHSFSSTSPNLAQVQATTSQTLDSIYVFFEQGLLSDHPTAGLPSSGMITSAFDPTTKFQLAAAASNTGGLNNNVLLLNPSSSGSLTLNSAASFKKISLLVDGFNGTHTTDYTLHFSNGNSLNGTFSAKDNFDQSGFAIEGFSRISRLDGGVQLSSNDPRMYQVDIALTGPFQGYNLSSISFTNTATGNFQNVGIWAVSGVAAAPEPASMTLLGLGVVALLKRRKKS